LRSEHAFKWWCGGEWWCGGDESELPARQLVLCGHAGEAGRPRRATGAACARGQGPAAAAVAAGSAGEAATRALLAGAAASGRDLPAAAAGDHSRGAAALLLHAA